MSPAFAETANVDVTTTPTQYQGGDGQIASPCQISGLSIIADMANFQFFKIAAAVILDY